MNTRATCKLCGQPIAHLATAWAALDGDTVRPGGIACPTATGEVTGHLPAPPMPLVAGYVATDGHTYCSTNPAAVTAVMVDTEAPRATLGADGYGETGTRYRLTLTDGRTRRVYVRQYGNAGSLGVYVRSVWASLDTDTEYRLQAARDAADAPAEVWIVQTWTGRRVWPDRTWPSFDEARAAITEYADAEADREHPGEVDAEAWEDTYNGLQDDLYAVRLDGAEL